MTTEGNVPADLTVTPDLASTAASLMVLAAGVVGPIPSDAEGRRRYGYRLAHEAASLAAAFERPMGGLAHYLAQVRATREKAPVKGILRAVELVDRGAARNGRASQKVKLTVESTSAGKFSKAGSEQVFFSDFTNAVGFGDFEQRARALVGRECLFHKYLEDTEDRGQGPTSIVIVSITPLGGGPEGNGHAATAAPAPRQAAQAAPAGPRGEDNPDAWFVTQGWRGKAEHDSERRTLRGALAASSDEVKKAFAEWFAGKGYRMDVAWTSQGAMLMKAKLTELLDAEEEAEAQRQVGAGAVTTPGYAYSDEPF